VTQGVWSVLDTLPDATVVVDSERRVVAVNEPAERLFGFAATSLHGRPVAEALAAMDESGRPVWAAGWHPSSHLRSVSGVPEQLITVRDAGHHELDLAATVSYRRSPNGEVDGAVISFRDVRHRARVSAAGGIEIVSTVSHELRSPLTSVKGYTSLLLTRWDRLSDDQKQMMLAQVNHDADRVTRLIGELLDISRIETGRLVLHRQLVDVPTLTESVVGKVQLEYPDLDASVHFAEGMPRVYVDPDKVEQVLTNLLENACKYASATGLRVTGAVESAEQGPALTVAVADRGEGITPDDLPRVFTKFFRRSEGKPTGSGLGLWISRGIVEAHGGRLVATSIPGEGSVFAFTLPMNDLEDLTAS
jgi:PAS domain S-box-containing protein